MEIRKLKLEGTYEIKPKIFSDSRGNFAETYISKVFEENQLGTEWVQENQSFTTRKGTIRGLHFQAPPFAQAKLIRVIAGRALDVFVDIRKNSPTFGKWDSIELSGEFCQAVYVPHGFAHGFCTLEDNTSVQYKVDNGYSRDHEFGIFWGDRELAIDWQTDSPILSEKDSDLPRFSEFDTPFV